MMSGSALQLRPTLRYSVFVFFVFFYTQQLEERKRMGERKKF
jgi:hypothetical protein